MIPCLLIKAISSSKKWQDEISMIFWKEQSPHRLIDVDDSVYYHSYMKTVQMTLDEDLIELVDRQVRKMGTTRSEFTRNALRAALKQIRTEELEEMHRAGYKRKPVKRGEFDAWENEQVWTEP
jgi:Arc/MetJ-type ribon-helix-helix transcriptional regulator